MGIMDFFKKIGILKTWDASGTYANAKERPDKFVEKDLYDGAASQTFDSNNNNGGNND